MSDSAPHPDILVALERTEAFERALLTQVNRGPFEDTDRMKLAMVFMGLAHEHWIAIRSLAGLGLTIRPLHSSGCGLRPH